MHWRCFNVVLFFKTFSRVTRHTFMSFFKVLLFLNKKFFWVERILEFCRCTSRLAILDDNDYCTFSALHTDTVVFLFTFFSKVQMLNFQLPLFALPTWIAISTLIRGLWLVPPWQMGMCSCVWEDNIFVSSFNIFVIFVDC